MDTELRALFARDIAGLPALGQQGEKDFAAAVNALAAFTREHGRAPEATVVSDRGEAQLGAWLEGQRAADRRDRLSAQRAAALQGALGSNWSS